MSIGDAQLNAKIEALLFLESKPLSFVALSRLCHVSVEEITAAALDLQNSYADRDAGVQLVIDDGHVQLTSARSVSDFVKEYLRAEDSAELTRPSLETLTIVAYRGPVAKSEIELIRGVNCSLILRNLMIRGLIEQTDTTESGSPVFAVTTTFLRHLGVGSTHELPEYEELNQNVHLQELLAQKDPQDFFTHNISS